jgi:alpha-glucosidase (family GH31 glycosyl hydrolase)
MGQAADWYMAPASAPLDFTRIFYELTGAPAIPPRYGVAFMATYWGYKTMEEVEGYMTQFRDGAFPIDSFIMDYGACLRQVPLAPPPLLLHGVQTHQPTAPLTLSIA